MKKAKKKNKMSERERRVFRKKRDGLTSPLGACREDIFPLFWVAGPSLIVNRSPRLGHCPILWWRPPKVQGITVCASPPLYLGHLRLHAFKRESQKMPFFMNV